jgi:hypothetical protein
VCQQPYPGHPRTSNSGVSARQRTVQGIFESR